MSEKSRHTPPNVRIVAKNDQTWSVDWADDPNEYCRSFNARARELNLGLVATPHFPKRRKVHRGWYWSGLASVLALIAYGLFWLFTPCWMFHNRDLVIRYPTRIHLWCNSPPTHYIHFREKPKQEAKVGQIIHPMYHKDGSFLGFEYGVEDNRMVYPVEEFAKIRNASSRTGS